MYKNCLMVVNELFLQTLSTDHDGQVCLNGVYFHMCMIKTITREFSACLKKYDASVLKLLKDMIYCRDMSFTSTEGLIALHDLLIHISAFKHIIEEVIERIKEKCDTDALKFFAKKADMKTCSEMINKNNKIFKEEYFTDKMLKSLDLTNMSTTLCICGSYARYGLETDEKPTRCNNCKSEDMIDIYKVKHKPKCGCGETAWFGTNRCITPTHCVKCKTADMGLIKALFCFCGKQASFAFENEKKPTHCKKCAVNGMVNIRYKKLRDRTVSSSSAPMPNIPPIIPDYELLNPHSGTPSLKKSPLKFVNSSLSTTSLPTLFGSLTPRSFTSNSSMKSGKDEYPETDEKVDIFF
jgi:hypothetical protein